MRPNGSRSRRAAARPSEDLVRRAAARAQEVADLAAVLVLRPQVGVPATLDVGEQHAVLGRSGGRTADAVRRMPGRGGWGSR